jgi:polyisoprenoid-binding protein YceI
MSRVCVLPALLLLSASPCLAATWTVDPSASKLGFVGTQTDQPFSGTFRKWSGTIDYDPAKPEAAHVAIAIDTGSATTADTQRDEALPGDDWFAAAKFPTATFEATGFTPKGDDKFETTGKLTIRGVSKDVALPFTLTLNGDTAHAQGEAKLVRTAFGVGQGAWATDQYVALDVAVSVDLTAKKAP